MCGVEYPSAHDLSTDRWGRFSQSKREAFLFRSAGGTDQVGGVADMAGLPTYQAAVCAAASRCLPPSSLALSADRCIGIINSLVVFRPD